MTYRYSLSNKRRIDCPFCGKAGKYSAFNNNVTDNLLPEEYGRCSSCGGEKRPEGNSKIAGGEGYSNLSEPGYYEADKVHISHLTYEYTPPNTPNHFFDGLAKHFGSEETNRVIEKYRLNRFIDGGVIFPYLLDNQTLCTGKILFFDRDLCRIKTGVKSKPLLLHNLWYLSEAGNDKYDTNIYEKNDKGKLVKIKFNLKFTLFGHHLILEDTRRTIGLVESEKTAVIMATVFPQITWVASGSLTYVQEYKFLFFTRRRCVVLPDLKDGDKDYEYWREKLKGYEANLNCEFIFIDYLNGYFSDAEQIKVFKQRGYDPADFILKHNDDNKYIDFLTPILEEHI